jgi:hypothetical protein
MNRRRREEELERDIADHIAMETEDNIARGMSPPEARSAALRKFGNVARVKEDTRSVWGCTALDTWCADVRHALRRIRRSPGTTALAVLSLALAFAPSVTVFSVMDRLFLTPLPIRSPGEIVEIQFRGLALGLAIAFPVALIAAAALAYYSRPRTSPAVRRHHCVEAPWILTLVGIGPGPQFRHRDGRHGRRRGAAGHPRAPHPARRYRSFRVGQASRPVHRAKLGPLASWRQSQGGPRDAPLPWG